jgi:hypothetical protein
VQVKDWANATEFLTKLAVRSGKLLKGGEPDLATVAVCVINDWQRGKLPFFVAPPEAELEDVRCLLYDFRIYLWEERNVFCTRALVCRKSVVLSVSLHLCMCVAGFSHVMLVSTGFLSRRCGKRSIWDPHSRATYVL